MNSPTDINSRPPTTGQPEYLKWYGGGGGGGGGGSSTFFLAGVCFLADPFFPLALAETCAVPFPLPFAGTEGGVDGGFIEGPALKTSGAFLALFG